jgi:hypothetical protein
MGPPRLESDGILSTSELTKLIQTLARAFEEVNQPRHDIVGKVDSRAEPSGVQLSERRDAGDVAKSDTARRPAPPAGFGR